MLACVGTIALLASACQQAPAPASQRFTLHFRVLADGQSDKPVAGARIAWHGQQLAQSGSDGRARATVQGQDGTLFRPTLQCPTGYRTPKTQPALRLRQVRPAAGGGKTAPLEIELHCRPRLRQLALIVRAQGAPSLPVIVDGERRGQTNAAGVAHLAFARPPHSRVRVHLDTSAHPKLHPQAPSRHFQLHDADQLAVFDQRFTPPPPKRRRTHRRRPRKQHRRHAPRHIPFRIR
ncbi:MAG: hypothetical protein ACPGUV_11255 [Polyangiales bacterium]